MNAKEFLNVALGGNMNIGTLKPKAWHGIMEDYARHKLLKQSDNSDSAKCKCPGSTDDDPCQWMHKGKCNFVG